MGKPAVEDLFVGNSEVAAALRSQFADTGETTHGAQLLHGAIATGFSNLKNAFGILLNSGCPMFLVWDCDPARGNFSKRILFYNDAYLALLRETQQLIPCGQSVNESWTKDWSGVQSDVEHVFTTGQLLRREKQLFSTNLTSSRNHYYTWSYNALWNETEQVSGVFATGFPASVEDIKSPTADSPKNNQEQCCSNDVQATRIENAPLQQAKAALQESEIRFQAFMSHSPTAAWITDRDGRLLYLSPTYTQMFHASQQSAVGKQIHDIYSSEFAQQFLENNRHVFDTGQVLETIETAPRFDGSIGSFLVYKFPIPQASGAMLLGGVAIDITERNHIEAALRRREEELSLITDALPVLIAYVDKDHYYRFNNKPYEAWLGQPTTDIVNKPVREALGETAYEAVRPYIEQALAGNRVSFESQLSYRNGETRYVSAEYVPHYNSQGGVEGFFSLVNDISDRKQAEKALEHYQLLSEYSRDIVLYFRSDGQILEANQAAVDAYGYDRAELLTLKIAALRAPNTLSIMPEQFEQALHQGILFETVHRRRDGTDFPVEVSAQSAVIGDETVLLSVIRNITERKKAELEREHLLVREQAAREVAEAAEQRASFLADASTTLTSSLDYEYTLNSVAQAVVPTLADWCAIDILDDDGTLERLAATHVDPAKMRWGKELHRRYPPNLNAPQGLAQVLRTGQSEYYPTISDDQIVAAARDAEHLAMLQEIGFSSVMLVPLNARGKTLGAISFVSAESGRSYRPDDLFLAEELARRAAIALDNARLYQDAQHARQAAERAVDRTVRLQTVTAALSESLTPVQVAEVIVEQSMSVLKATAVLVVLVSKDRTELEIVKSIGYTEDLVDSWRRFSINADVPLAEAIRTGEPAWFETILSRIATYPHLAEIYKQYDFKAWIALPLVVEGKSVGGMLLSFKEFKHLDQDDRDFVLALTQQCAQAIVRAQLYGAEQQARAEAERANRIKDEFLAVLSHELRSPLNPILGWSKLLRNGKLDATRTAHALETIERNAQLQVQLIDDLLDVSRILSGKLTLNVTLVDLSFIISAALETVQLAAEAKSLQIQTIISLTNGRVSGDAGRLQQVVWNLMSNAVKFTPASGSITLELASVGTNAQIQVKDTGKGINPNFLPYVFEYFRQEDGTTTRKFGGLGLGLAIVRQIIELHGGTVAVDSPGEGQGTTFTVQIPLADEPVALPTVHHKPEVMLDLSGIHVLLVDDETDSREVIAFVLQQANATVTSVASGIEALQHIHQWIPDIIVSDIGMPNMDGYMLMQQIRGLDRGRTIPAIALTAYAGEINQKQAFAVGFQHHLTKPVEPGMIVTTIANLIKQTH